MYADGLTKVRNIGQAYKLPQLLDTLRINMLACWMRMFRSCAHHLCTALRRPLQHGVKIAHAANALPPRHVLADLPAIEQLAQHGAAQEKVKTQVLSLACSRAKVVGTVQNGKQTILDDVL